MNDLVEVGELALQELMSLDAPEQAMLQLPQVECSVVHHFGPGVCIREVFMPAGTLAIGHKQKFEHPNIMLPGKVLVANDDGTTQVLTAPMIFTGKPGRKIGYVMEDMVWQNVYATDLKDASAVEDFFIEKSEQWHDDQALRFALESVSRAADRNDYMLLLEECGIAHSQARQQSENEDDQMWVENSITRVDISPIEGKGLFASLDLSANMRIYDYIGEEMSWKEFTEQYGLYKYNSLNTYPMRRIHKIIVAKNEPYKTDNLVNYINEGKEANVYLKSRGLYTLREIKKDEELLLIYPKDYLRSYSL